MEEHEETYSECVERLNEAEEDWESANNVVGAGGGALAGGIVGSFFGPVGTVVGAVGGAIAGALGEEYLNDKTEEAFDNLREEQCEPLRDGYSES